MIACADKEVIFYRGPTSFRFFELKRKGRVRRLTRLSALCAFRFHSRSKTMSRKIFDGMRPRFRQVILPQFLDFARKCFEVFLRIRQEMSSCRISIEVFQLVRLMRTGLTLGW